MRSQLKAGAILSYLLLVLNSAISIVYTPIMLKLVGQSDYGLFSLASSAIGYVSILNFGLGNAVIRYTAKYKAIGDQEKCNQLYGMFSVMYGVLGFLALIAGIIVTFFSETIFSNSLTGEEVIKLKVLIGIMALNLAVGIGFGVFSVIVLAHEKFIYQKTLNIISSMITPLLTWPLLEMGYGVITISVVNTVISLITILLNIHYCFKVLKIKIVFKKFESSLLKEILVFSSYIFLNLVIGQLYWSTDQVILGIYSGTVAVSIYSLAASFTGYFSGFSSAISNVFLSKVSRMVAQNLPDKEISDLFIRIGRVQYIVISFALSGFIVFGKEFIVLWVGKNYSESFIIALLILIPMIVSLIQGMGGIVLQAKNMQKFKSVVNVLIAIVNVVISIIFVRYWGAIGCALGTALAYTIGNIIIINIYYWRKVGINIPLFWKNILKMSFPMLLSVIYSMTINLNFSANDWLFFIFKTLIFSISYILIMWFAGMNNYEKSLFLIPLKNVIQKLTLKMKEVKMHI
ncbi:lipopolysaccharide biosynthesis protein [Fictibacillus fluitans]|uniref:Oligosaccharide flippase family protein n=1 Tax=Fictibacillus fluitans TaxID=3058422 RepID=A0ABT8I154_9BACL|nr:oligosaccharide flippase family protein [Fictibacillus sp. NE201]MDN4526718.1 oligosaccharide flippase family protein [Fictibacillus sp. NE201]